MNKQKTAIVADSAPDEYEFERLFKPMSVGNVNLRNRLMMTGHTTNYASGNEITQDLIDYYVERAEGGIGLIVMAYLANHPSSVTGSAIHGWDENIVPGLRRLTDAVHDAGAKIFCQNLHYGRQMTSLLTERPVLSASDIPGPVNREMPKRMVSAEIEEIVDSYARTAEIIQRGGFDGVEIHSGYGGYFLSQFLSPYTNDRTDEYGGSTENRLRIVRETLDAVRKRVGDEYVVGLQINATDDAPGGAGVDEYEEIARRLAATGQVDYLVVKAGTYLKQDYIVPDMQRDRALLAPLAKRLRTAVREENPEITVATTGRITDPRTADQLLVEGAADLVSMTRGHIADPAVAEKAKEGRLDELIECMGCNQGCIERVYNGAECRCVLNPATGFEADLGTGTLNPAEPTREILVVGGGPAGMKAASVAAKRGHEVTLYEKDDTLGGQARFAKEIPGREEFEKPVLWLREALDRNDADYETGVTVTTDLIDETDPDAVVVATGSSPPSFPQGYRGHGIGPDDVPGWEDATVLSSVDVLDGRRLDADDRALVIDDGEDYWKGVGTVRYLDEEGVNVHLAITGGEPGEKLTGPSKAKLHRDLFGSAQPPEIHEFAFVDEIEWPQATLDTKGRSVAIEDLDAIVLAGFRRANTGLLDALREREVPAHEIGDAATPRTIMEAIHEGERIARRL